MSPPCVTHRGLFPVRRFDGFAIRREIVLTSLCLLCSGDLQSPVIGSGSFVIGGLQIPRFHRSNLFFYGGFQIRRGGYNLFSMACHARYR